MSKRTAWLLEATIVGLLFAVALKAKADDYGEYPWCTTDGYIYECYYTTPGSCENAAEMAGGSRWCERNPDIYRDRADDREWWKKDPEIKGWYGTI